LLAANVTVPCWDVVACRFVAWSLTLPCCVLTTNHLKWRRQKHPTLCCCSRSVSSLRKVSTAVLSHLPLADRCYWHWL